MLQDLLLLSEERKSGVVYLEKKARDEVERVIATLSGSDAGVFTKLTRQFKSLDTAVKKMTTKRDERSDQIKAKFAEIFDAEDVVLTRVIATTQFVATMTKETPPETETSEKKTPDYEKIVEELTKLIQPELQAKVEEIIALYTQVEIVKNKPTKSRLSSVTKVDEGLYDVVSSMAASVKRLWGEIRRWGSRYDRKLHHLMKLAHVSASQPK